MSDTHDNCNKICQQNSKLNEKKTSSVNKNLYPLEKELICVLLVIMFGVRIIEVRIIEVWIIEDAL